MKKGGLQFAMLLVASAAVLFNPFACSATDKPPEEGAVLPEMKLPVPQNSEEVKYLGIKQKDFFRIPQVQAELVIIEVFSMYCPFCQKEAPVVNELHQIIAGSQDLKKKIKMLGIGAGNSTFEVNTFMKHYSVPFPLFPDSDFAMHKALGQVRTPYFIVIRISPDGSHKVVYSKVGGFGDPKQFLDLLLSKAQMK